MNVHRCMIIPLANTINAQIICENLAGPPGSNMFRVPVYTAGIHTHYISSGGIQEYFAGLMPFKTVDFIEIAPDQYEYQVTNSAPGDAQTTYDQLQLLPSPPAITLADIQALFAAADVSAQNPHLALSRLGMSLTS